MVKFVFLSHHSAATCATIEEETSVEEEETCSSVEDVEDGATPTTPVTTRAAHPGVATKNKNKNNNVCETKNTIATKLLFAKMKELQSLMLKPADMKPR